MAKKTTLTPEEKLRVAHAHFINGIEQHHLASLMGINSGRVAEACKTIGAAAGLKPRKSTQSELDV